MNFIGVMDINGASHLLNGNNKGYMKKQDGEIVEIDIEKTIVVTEKETNKKIMTYYTGRIRIPIEEKSFLRKLFGMKQKKKTKEIKAIDSETIKVLLKNYFEMTKSLPSGLDGLYIYVYGTREEAIKGQVDPGLMSLIKKEEKEQ